MPRRPKPEVPGAWRNRIVGTGTEDPEQLLANPANWRIHPQAQQAALAGSLNEVGWVQAVMVNTETGHVVDGHARVALALSRHEQAVPVIYVTLSLEEERKVLATLDPIAAMAGSDQEKLAELIEGLEVADVGLAELFEELRIESAPGSERADRDTAGQPVLSYQIIFDDEEQQNRWTAFLIQLRREHPEEPTIAARIHAHLGPAE